MAVVAGMLAAEVVAAGITSFKDKRGSNTGIFVFCCDNLNHRMKRSPFVFAVLFFLSLAACKKHSGAVNNTSLASISLYYPSAHILTTQRFLYSEGALSTYYEKTVDSGNGGPNPLWESRTHSFSYSSGPGPSSYTFTDSTNLGSNTNVMVLGGEVFNFFYDTHNRLIEETSTITTPYEDSANWYNSYAGDTIYMNTSNGRTYGAPSDTILLSNGNLVTVPGETVTYSTVANPMQNASIANSYGVLFFNGFIGMYLDFWTYPVDVYSRNLPAGYVDRNGNKTSFTWNTDANGRVTSGVATNLYGPAFGGNEQTIITFTYQ